MYKALSARSTKTELCLNGRRIAVLKLAEIARFAASLYFLKIAFFNHWVE
jgi:hypothetical protein